MAVDGTLLRMNDFSGWDLDACWKDNNGFVRWKRGDQFLKAKVNDWLILKNWSLLFMTLEENKNYGQAKHSYDENLVWLLVLDEILYFRKSLLPCYPNKRAEQRK